MIDYHQLENELGVAFCDKNLLKLALAHSSFLNENLQTSSGSNERLEFLGDAAIGLVVAHELYKRHPGYTEGELTELRASIVQGKSLTEVGRKLRLGQYLYMGRGEANTGGRDRDSNLARAVEALVGAVLIDQGYDIAKMLTLRLLEEMLARTEHHVIHRNPKSRLQETLQRHGLPTPTYTVISATEPGNSRQFTVQVAVGTHIMGCGNGRRKTDAEREAAAHALETLNKYGLHRNV